MNPRLRRLQADYELMREVFSGHPHIGMEPMGRPFPPERYALDFRVRGLHLAGGQPDYRDAHRLEMTLPRRYPAEKPYVVPIDPIFHPNIREFVCIADYWAADSMLADVVIKLGDMIQWRVYNCSSPLDAQAARWALEHESSGLFPIGDVDLGVEEVNVQVRGEPGRAVEIEDGPAFSTSAEELVADSLALPPIAGAQTPEDSELVVLVHRGQSWT
jgi:ubiquitin-protein ligase